MRRFVSFVTLVSFVCVPCVAHAQSTNTSTIVVLVTDPSGAVVRGAQVSVSNDQTGASRQLTSGSNGIAIIAALPLTGTYTVVASLEGFITVRWQNIVLRAGETARINITLGLPSIPSEVTVYGTAQGVRADSQIGRRLDAPTIDETPILGRKITSLPLFNAAFRQGKGTGDLSVSATY